MNLNGRMKMCRVKVLKNLQTRHTLHSLAALLDTPPGPMPRPDITAKERQDIAAYLLTREED